MPNHDANAPDKTVMCTLYGLPDPEKVIWLLRIPVFSFVGVRWGCDPIQRFSSVESGLKQAQAVETECRNSTGVNAA